MPETLRSFFSEEKIVNERVGYGETFYLSTKLTRTRQVLTKFFLSWLLFLGGSKIICFWVLYWLLFELEFFFSFPVEVLLALLSQVCDNYVFSPSTTSFIVLLFSNSILLLLVLEIFLCENRAIYCINYFYFDFLCITFIDYSVIFTQLKLLLLNWSFLIFGTYILVQEKFYFGYYIGPGIKWLPFMSFCSG